MYRKLLLPLFLAAFFFSGCVKNTPLSLFAQKTTISTENVNEALAKVFPIQKKSSFGSVALKRAILIPARESSKVALSVGFGLTSFEIPEGIDGVLTLSAGLRYDPKTKKIYLKEVTPIGVNFGNPSLSEYVSKGARTALNVIAMRELSDIEIYQVKESFSARFIKHIKVDKGKIVIEYGL
ncbi:MAG: DUF1439 domain-containing protein [Sulfurovum sp.]|nr:DUF1439 domain-containing protein [Sulfurovum sp.]